VNKVQSDNLKSAETTVDDLHAKWHSVVRRRAFLKGLGVAGAMVPTGGLLAVGAKAASAKQGAATGILTAGDAAILRFLAAAEILETDLWQQYNELGGVAGGNPAYMAALQNLDGDMSQYISDNTDDEVSHAAFLNAYLKSRGAEQVNLDEFRILPSSHASGARQVGRWTTSACGTTRWATRSPSRWRASSTPRPGSRSQISTASTPSCLRPT